MKPIVCWFKTTEPDHWPGQGEHEVYRFDLRAVPRELWKKPEQPGGEYAVPVILKVTRLFLESGTWPEASQETRSDCFAYYVRKQMESIEEFPAKGFELNDKDSLASGPVDLSEVDLNAPFIVGGDGGRVVDGFAKRQGPPNSP